MFTIPNRSHYYTITVFQSWFPFLLFLFHPHTSSYSISISLSNTLYYKHKSEKLVVFWPEQRQHFLLLWKVGKSIIIKKYNKKGRANVIVKLLSGRCFCSYITSNTVTNFELVLKLVFKSALRQNINISIKIAIFSNNKLFGVM
jgi:hypothetical protein